VSTSCQWAVNRVALCPLPRAPDWPTPLQLDQAGLNTLRDDYKTTTKRTSNLKLDCLELHMAHGYLLHEFLSPVSNPRSDEYGGNVQKRARFLLDMAALVRDEWPNDRILGAHVTGSDWLTDEITVSDRIDLAGQLSDIGFDYVCVSSGGILPITGRPTRSGYQVHLSVSIKIYVDIITHTVGMILGEAHANQILAAKQADLIGFSRKFICDPRWLYTVGERGPTRPRPADPYAKCLA